jgi:hypothetical protein
MNLIEANVQVFRSNLRICKQDPLLLNDCHETPSQNPKPKFLAMTVIL